MLARFGMALLPEVASGWIRRGKLCRRDDQIDSAVEPDCIGNDIWSESVAFVCVHASILSILAI